MATETMETMETTEVGGHGRAGDRRWRLEGAENRGRKLRKKCGKTGVEDGGSSRRFYQEQVSFFDGANLSFLTVLDELMRRADGGRDEKERMISPFAKNE